MVRYRRVENSSQVTVLLCRWTGLSQRFEGSYCLQLHGQAAQGLDCLDSLTMKLKTVRSFETSETTRPMTQRHSSEDPNLQQCSYEKLNSHFTGCLFVTEMSPHQSLLTYNYWRTYGDGQSHVAYVNLGSVLRKLKEPEGNFPQIKSKPRLHLNAF